MPVPSYVVYLQESSRWIEVNENDTFLLYALSLWGDSVFFEIILTQGPGQQ